MRADTREGDKAGDPRGAVQAVDAPPLAEGDVHIWRVSTARIAPAWAREQLTAAEADRAARFASDRDRADWCAAHAALRTLAGRYSATAPRDVVFDRQPGGKPFLPGARFDFNLSHTNGCSLIGFSMGGDIGIDVERLRDDPGALEAAPTVLAADEIQRLMAASLERRVAEFLALWTRKEAWLKMLGRGLVDDLPAYSLIEPGNLPADIRPDTLAAVDAGPGCLAAAALRERPRTMLVFDFEP